MLSNSSVSKASPLGQDLKTIVLVNVAALVTMVLFGVLGLAVAHAATGSGFFF